MEPQTHSMKSSIGLEKALVEAGVARSDGWHAFRTYLNLLEKWGRRINLTASTEWRTIGPLFEEAIWAAGYYVERESVHLDIGSGAGFPAVPMRILRPKMRLHMLESRFKRAAFLETVVGELDLAGTVVTRDRLRDFLHLKEDHSQPWDTVSWKAIRLDSEDVSLLLKCSQAYTEFWLFHGSELPLVDASAWDRSTRLIRRFPCPVKEAWYLSIYGKKPS